MRARVSMYDISIKPSKFSFGKLAIVVKRCIFALLFMFQKYVFITHESINQAYNTPNIVLQRRRPSFRVAVHRSTGLNSLNPMCQLRECPLAVYLDCLSMSFVFEIETPAFYLSMKQRS